MCDDDIHQGLVQDPAVSRRTFGALTMAAAGLAAGGASAQSKVIERDVSIRTPDGVCDAALALPVGKGPFPAVLIWPDILGLGPAFRDMARRLAESGYVALAVNPYYRVKKAPAVEGPFNFSNPDDRAKVMPLRVSLTDQTTDRDAVAFLAYLDGLPEVSKAAKVGVQGYCMGGALTLRTAAAVPNRVGAGASFHGGGLVTDKPDSPHLLIPKLKGQYLIAIADNDDKAQPAAKDALKAAFAAAKIPAVVEVYPGAMHGWCVKGSAVYNEAAAEKAWAELMALYKRSLA